MTPPSAAEPYKLEEGPFTISTCLTFSRLNLSKFMLPENLPMDGTPFIRI